MTKPSTALVIGTSRGLGLALVEEWRGRGWRVAATARGHSDQLATLATRFPGSLETEAVDTNSADSVQSLQQRLNDHHFDVLFVNAGIARSIESTPVDVDETDFLDMMLTNALAPVRTIELLRNLVLDRGVLAVMSSELGSSAQNANSGWQLYSVSKAALNMLMKGYARHAILVARARSCWSPRAGSAQNLAETMHRSPLARAFHWWWTRLTRTEASRACAISIASINPCPGDRGVFALQASAEF